MGSKRRKALPFKAKMPDIANISRLLNELPACFRVTLQGKFGQILDLLSVDVQTPVIIVLAQIYDPPLRSFFFQDFQLTPTLEEFDRLLGFFMKGKTPYNRIGQVPEVEMLALALHIPISDALANWKKRENLFGFWRAYLEEEAKRLFVIHHWDALANILALLIYGLVLFPTHEGFIDSASISIFWAVWKDKQSLVPLVLADTFHTLHTRHQKKNGMLICCLPLLYNWLISYVFKPNAHISEMSNWEWARTLVSLSSKDIIWYRHKLNVEEIIISCGSFPNVSLIGSKGYISYNPMLALRQFGYPMRGKPDDKELEEMVLNDMGTNDPFLLRKITRSWEKVHTIGIELVKKNGAARVPYQQWVSERIKVVKLPFSIEIPLKSTSPEPVPVSLEEVEELRAMVAKLGKEKEDLQSELYKETRENMILKRKSNQRKELLEESRKKNRIEQDLKERVLECLDQANSGLGSLHDQLSKAKRDGQEWKR
ncbi:uncharacterized protein LOC127137325 [Lathyrus oleraceus]|uniref:uncharacterized protein LOC127137325 n=1 Tax=Pisum sativum TaxID=3888 RepID=UPI0021D1FB5A|nr:uncharacterized protein LOC127137325 [Pisum sativum]